MALSDYELVIISAVVLFTLSAIMHWPNLGTTSDITTSFWKDRVNAAGVPYVTYEIPYVQYVFEYPPICGIVLWIAGWSSFGNLYVYTGIMFVILGIFFVLNAHFLYKFLVCLHFDHNLQLLCTIFIPSVVVFGAYNFDFIQAFFMVVSLYFFVARRKTSWSAFFLGLSIATKLFPALLIPLFIQELRVSKERMRFAFISLAVPASIALPFAYLNFSNFIAGYTYLRNWGLEATFLLWIFPSKSSWGLAELVSGILVLSSSLLVYFGLRRQPLLLRCFLILGSFILFSYMSPPQFNLDLIPLFALVPLAPLSLFYLFEYSTTGFIAVWAFFPSSSSSGVVLALATLRQIALGVILCYLVLNHALMRRVKTL